MKNTRRVTLTTDSNPMHPIWIRSIGERYAHRLSLSFFSYMLALAFIGKAASLLFFFLAWWSYIPPVGKTIGPNSRQETTTAGANISLMPNDIPSNDLQLTPATIAPMMDA